MPVRDATLKSPCPAEEERERENSEEEYRTESIVRLSASEDQALQEEIPLAFSCARVRYRSRAGRTGKREREREEAYEKFIRAVTAAAAY